MKQVLFKAEPDDVERWKRKARDQGLSLSEWIRRRLDSADGLTQVAQVVRASVTSNGACLHRIPPGTWCKRCGKVKK